jgi:hypothetical protein
MAINIVTPKVPRQPTLPSGIAPDFSLVQQQFPKVAEKIALMWGTLGLQEYLSKTIFDERGGRQGFPMPVVSALMRLFEYHTTLIPVVPSSDTWENTI